MLLAEQGHAVTKWVRGRDPIEQLRDGDKLWQWINYGKTVVIGRRRTPFMRSATSTP